MPESAQKQVYVLGEMAQKKWDELDSDESGELEGEEVMEMAAWVWKSFRPGQSITSEIKESESTKMLLRCDADSDGKIGKEEFGLYYEKYAVSMIKFNESLAKKKTKQKKSRILKEEKPEPVKVEIKELDVILKSS